ncbi:MAG: hypothetical protein ACI9T9_000714 [Oleiphilaceae bacterium]|jgi:hypothetical protein
MQDLSSLTNAVVFSGLIGMAGIFVWIGFVIYLKIKWLRILEDKLDEGDRFYSLNIFLAGQGVLQYATIFLSKFYAKRYGMLEKRDDVPKHIQRLFIFSFIWFMTSGLLMVASFIVFKNYIRPE